MRHALARLSPLVLVIGAANGCAREVASAGDQPGVVDAPDASVSPRAREERVESASTTSIASPDPIAARLAPFPMLARRLHGARLEARASGFVRVTSSESERAGLRAADGAAGFRSLGSALRVEVPREADGALRLARGSLDGHEDDASIEVRALDVEPVHGATTGDAVLFERARAGEDLVQVATDDGVEELRLIAAPRAAIEARWAIHARRGVSRVIVEGGRVEAIDARGVPAIVGEPIVAIDARGARRAARVSLEQARDGGVVITARVDAAGLDFPVALDPAWTAGGLLTASRTGGSAALLSTGDVIYAGGSTTSFADVFRVATSSWVASPGGTAATNWVLGSTSAGVLAAGPATAMLYAPTTNSWSSAGVPVVARTSSAGAAIGGYMVVGGGRDATTAVTATTEIWTSATKTWTAGPSLSAARMWLTATPLPSGKVLFVGGSNGGPSVANVDLYDPATATVTPVAPLTLARAKHTATLLPSGKVLVTGGLGSGPSVRFSTTEIYDPATNTWSNGPFMAQLRAGHAAALVSGRVLVVGGVASPSTAEIYDPAKNLFYPVANSRFGVQDGIAVTLASGATTLVSSGNQSELFALGAQGATCAADGDCQNERCVDGRCCASTCTGQCQACDVAGSEGTCASVTGLPHGTRPSCGAYACAAGACGTACTSDAECGAGYFCGGGSCGPKAVNGAACTEARTCASGLCVDGVCCDKACGAQCEACDVPGREGTCTTVDGPPHGARTSCSPGLCVAGACAGTCAVQSDCASDAWCSAGSCTPKKANGVACGTPWQCTSNHCVDGVCCDAKCDGQCVACDVTGALGTCSQVAGAPHGARPSCSPSICAAGACAASCTDDAGCAADGWCTTAGVCARRKILGDTCGGGHECVSGICADGRCCNGACGGACEACDLAGQEGSCAPVVGAPHGARTCGATSSDPCAARACDGARDRTACVAFVHGPETVCGAPSCAGALLTPAPHCDGKGSCAAPDHVSCAPYQCAAAACLTACKADADCAQGHACKAGACVAKPRVALCSDDGRSSIGTDGTSTLCDPYGCGEDGTCRTRCATSDQCAPGASCDVGRGTCEASQTGTDSGGCSVGGGSDARRRAGGGAGALLLALGTMMALRRRARRAGSAVAIVLSSAGCASPAPEGESLDAGASARVPEGASVEAASVTPPTPARTLSTLRAMSPFRATLDAARGDARGEARGDAGAWQSPGEALEVSLPARASGPLRIALARDPETSLEIVAEQAGDAPSVAIDGVGVAIGDDRHADVVHIASRALVEEIRLLRAEGALATARYRIRGGPRVEALRLVDGRVEALDRDGVVRLASAPMFAVDARGARRTPTLRAIPSADAGRAALALEVSLDTEGLSFPIAIDPIWIAATKPSYYHNGHTATALASGKVLIAGGYTPAPVSEVFDPTTGTWAAGTMRENRYGHAAVRLADGRVLAISGAGATGSVARLSSSELFDPATGAWTLSGRVSAGRVDARAVLLPSGKALYVGGIYGPERFSAAELYDPATGVWSLTGPMASPRYGHSLVLLASGKVLVAGGFTLSTAELYDPAKGTWAATGALSGVRRYHTASLLADGRVLVAGGTNGVTELSTAELYDPTKGTWTLTAPMSGARTAHAAAGISRGRVLVSGGTAGGVTLSTSEVFDPATSSWATVGALKTARSGHTETSLADGRVLAMSSTAPELYVTSPNGAACGAAGECESGFCVDGVCCATACNGKCDACNVAGSLGTCKPISGASQAGHPTCWPFVCAAGVCPTSCTSTPQCGSGASCTGNVCVGFKAAGVACGAASECASGFCVDGVCCDKACAGSCVACDVAGSLGRCSPVSGAPHVGRAACASGFQCVAGACPTSCTGDSACVAGSFCDGGACAPRKAIGATCIYDFECASGACADGVCCDQACGGQCQACDVAGAIGTCTAVDGAVHGARPKCAPFACVAGVCAASCTDDAACAATAWCDAGTCAAKGALGVACADDRACASGHCADGVCCDAKCDGQCEACSAAGACEAVVGAPKGGRAACDAGGGNACAARGCNGSDRRKCAAFVASTTLACALPKCVDGSFVATARCDGAGGCATPFPTSCVPYACAASGCLTSCASAADCADGYACNAGACEAPAARCSDDRSAAIDRDGLITACGKYLCRSDGTCGTNCASSTDCAPGFLCEVASHACVSSAALTPKAADAGGGCQAAPRGEGHERSACSLVVAALALLVTRARRSRGRRST